jgi:hypothetical protein
MPEPETPRPDWPTQAADAVVRYVDQIRAGTTDRVMTLAKGVVYGTFLLILGALLGILAVLGAFRGVDRVRELIVSDSVWITYVSLGVVFVLGGQFLFSKRKRAQ